jgi:hypothetical protein
MVCLKVCVWFGASHQTGKGGQNFLTGRELTFPVNQKKSAREVRPGRLLGRGRNKKKYPISKKEFKKMEMSKIEAEIKKAVKAYKQEYARQLTDLDKMIEDILTGNQSFPDFLAG